MPSPIYMVAVILNDADDNPVIQTEGLPGCTFAFSIQAPVAVGAVGVTGSSVTLDANVPLFVIGDLANGGDGDTSDPGYILTQPLLAALQSYFEDRDWSDVTSGIEGAGYTGPFTFASFSVQEVYSTATDETP